MSVTLLEKFDSEWPTRWQRQMMPGADLAVHEPGVLRFTKLPAPAHPYVNAQLDDYQQLARRHFRWSPPLTLTVRARFSASADQLTGTAGFGFWNDPFGMSGRRWPSLPRALWCFFAAPPSNLALARAVPGWGWKAAAIDAWRWPALALLPAAPIGFPLMRIPALYRRLWPIAQKAIGVCEAPIRTSMAEWHEYRIEWGERSAQIVVDGQVVLGCSTSPRGPLGLVIWFDNQMMVVTPQGQFRHGIVTTAQEQWMEIGGVWVE